MLNWRLLTRTCRVCSCAVASTAATNVVLPITANRKTFSQLSSLQRDALDKLFDGVVNNKRADLARAITLIETTNDVKKTYARFLLDKVLKQLKANRESNGKTCLRVGITGPPGAGKSSLIESFGKYITTVKGARLAVLTVDPTSSTTGGSILGDKVRMQELSRDPRAYIRSSPNKCTLGGVAMTTLETIFVCEAAQFDIILVETVGVGQAEHAIVDMVDCMILLIPPGSGDELQGLKKGIAEVADIVAITKYDSSLKQDAIRVKSEYQSALKYVRKKCKFWTPKIILTSAADNLGMDKLHDALYEYKSLMTENNAFYAKREEQLRLWFWSHLKQHLLDMLLASNEMKTRLHALELEVMNGNLTPSQAVDLILADIYATKK